MITRKHQGEGGLQPTKPIPFCRGSPGWWVRGRFLTWYPRSWGTLVKMDLAELVLKLGLTRKYTDAPRRRSGILTTGWWSKESLSPECLGTLWGSIGCAPGAPHNAKVRRCPPRGRKCLYTATVKRESYSMILVKNGEMGFIQGHRNTCRNLCYRILESGRDWAQLQMQQE